MAMANSIQTRVSPIEKIKPPVYTPRPHGNGERDPQIY